MTETDREAFVEGLVILAETLGEALSPGKIRGYFEGLRDLPLNTVLAAMRHALGTAKFFPKPGDLREWVEGRPDDRSALAWTRLLRALAEVGTYQSVDFGDQALHATVEALGGWHEAWRIERLDAKDQGFKRAEFCRLYGALEGRGATIGAVLRRLVGQHEIANHRAGFGCQGADLVRIGDDGRPVALPAGREPAALESGVSA